MKGWELDLVNGMAHHERKTNITVGPFRLFLSFIFCDPSRRNQRLYQTPWARQDYWLYWFGRGRQPQMITPSCPARPLQHRASFLGTF